MSAPARLEELREAIAAGDAHTVRVCFPDHYGVLRGRRIAAEVFAADPDARQGFCDGALVWDIRCEIFEATDFSNFRTGYPDLYVRPDHETLRPCAWTAGEWSVFGDCRDEHGATIDVDPRGILRTVSSRAGAPLVTTQLELHLRGDGSDRLLAGIRAAASGIGIELSSLEHAEGEGIARFALPALAPLVAADALVTLRTAARELAAGREVDMTAMSQTEERGRATRLLVEVSHESGEPKRLNAAEELALLLRPLPAGATGITSSTNGVIQAASDANPYLAIAASIAAAAEGESVSLASASDPYRSSIERLSASSIAREWFSGRFIHDAVALAEREARISESAGGPWDTARYRECG